MKGHQRYLMAAFAAVGFVGLGTLALGAAVAAPRDGGKSFDLRAKTAELREANYAADVEAMARLAAELRDAAADPRQPELWLVHYEAAMASWLHGSFVGPGSLANPQGDLPQMLRHLKEAATSFEACVELRPDFAEAHMSLATLYGMRASLEPERAAELASRSRAARERALAVGPRKPRVVLGDAGYLFWVPAQAGGNRDRALARYREALDLFAAEPEEERELHAWGEPDAWAFAAIAYLAMEPPDTKAAKAAVDTALALRPDFAWVKGYVVPLVDRAAASSGRGSGR